MTKLQDSMGQIRKFPIFLLILQLIMANTVHAIERDEDQSFNPYLPSEALSYPDSQVLYGYRDRDHSLGESLTHVAGLYALTWLMYPFVMPSTFENEGSFSRYKENFGRVVWDKDEPFWNWMIHPISGSQLYLFYRANGYHRWRAVGMTFISQALWEFTVEVYTEPTSFQDNYITTVWGSILGFGLENFSMKLLNHGSKTAKFFGHLLNPSTLFWFYEGKVEFIPQVDFRQGKEHYAGMLVFSF